MFRMRPGHADGQLISNRVDNVVRGLSVLRRSAEAGNVTHRSSGQSAGAE